LDLVKFNDNYVELVATNLSTVRYANNTSEIVNDAIAVGVALDIKYNYGMGGGLLTKRELMQDVIIDSNGTTILDALLQNEITEEEFYTIS
jgi:hypothetical protein